MRYRSLGALGGLVLPVGFSGVLHAQTNPAPQAVPFSEDFGTTPFSTAPAGFAAWGSGLSSQPRSIADAEAINYDQDVAIVAATSVVNSSAGTYGFASGGNARHAVITGPNFIDGTPGLGMAIDTSGLGGPAGQL